MRILVICNSATGLMDFRGMLLRELLKKENKLFAIVPLSREEKERIAENWLESIGCELKKIPIERRGINPIKDFKLMVLFDRHIRKVRPDLVITYTIKPNIYGGLICSTKKIPYIANVTGLGSAFQRGKALQTLITLLYKCAMRRAKIICFENEENRDKMVAYGIMPKERTHVLAGAGVDLQYFTYVEYPRDNKETRFLFIGRIMKEKGIDELLSATRRLVENHYNCSLVLLGEFEEDYEKKIHECEKEGWLYYYGYQMDVRPFISQCHCFVLPSWHEGMANTNLECAAMGRPLITSNIHGCKEAVKDNISGYLVQKGNEESLYQAMKQFMHLSYEERKHMGEAGRKHMERMFDKRKVVQETITFI